CRTKYMEMSKCSKYVKQIRKSSSGKKPGASKESLLGKSIWDWQIQIKTKVAHSGLEATFNVNRFNTKALISISNRIVKKKMKKIFSYLSPRFEQALKKLPREIKLLFSDKIRQFEDNWRHPALRVKRVQGPDNI
ncbi:MAG TPA: hypothetical protein VN370_08515, partial [Desulfitobacteriaceae bacterium]|nr:hypothetical protein [Desulfitobacteriaceae bacterium]